MCAPPLLRCSGWLRGVWMPFPPNLNPYRALQEEAPPEPHQAPAGFTTGEPPSRMAGKRSQCGPGHHA